MPRRRRSSGGGRPTPLAELSAADVGAWRELAERAAEPNPFLDPDFVLPAARGLGELGEVAVAHVERDGSWIACLPVRRYRRWHGLPVPCLASWRHTYCLLGTPLIAEDAGPRGLAELFAAIAGAGGRDGMGLDWVATDGAVGAWLAEAAPRAISLNRFERAFVRRRAEETYLDGSVKGKHRREFRRLAAGLAEELGEPLALTDRTGDAAAAERFLALEAAGWKGEAGTALLSDPAHAEFFRESARLLAERGLAELRFLEAGDAVSAARFSLRSGGLDFCFKVAYDEELRRFSPGREIELRELSAFHADSSLAAIDSCTSPDNQLFNRLYPDRRPIETFWIPGSGPLGRGVGAALGIAARRRAARPTEPS